MSRYKVRYLQDALRDLEDMASYLQFQLSNPAYAAKLREKIVRSVTRLGAMPFMGSPLRARYPVETDLRFLVVEKYLIFYRVTGETVEVTRIINGRTDYLSTLVL